MICYNYNINRKFLNKKGNEKGCQVSVITNKFHVHQSQAQIEIHLTVS